MRDINNKGFTLVELIATIVILALVMGIGAYSVTSIINKSKDKDYDLLIENINNAAESYYIECKFANNDSCEPPITITLQTLVDSGFLKGNSTFKEGDNKDKFTIVNPSKNDDNISDCKISITYNDGKIEVVAVNPKESCPTNY